MLQGIICNNDEYTIYIKDRKYQFTDKYYRTMVERMNQNVHQCMLFFLLEFLKDVNTKAYYNGDHIIVGELGTLLERYLPLEAYGLQPLLNEFVDLNDFEKQLLKMYFYKNGT